MEAIILTVIFLAAILAITRLSKKGVKRTKGGGATAPKENGKPTPPKEEENNHQK